MKISPKHTKAINERVPEGKRQAFVDGALEAALERLPKAKTKPSNGTKAATGLAIELYVDGGSRGNPGPSGGGYAAYRNGKQVLKGSKFFGRKTNNQAEYLALREALREVYAKLGDGPIVCMMDSQLAVEQISGNYKVKSENIKPLHEEICAIKEQFADFTIYHIPREQNSVADALANQVMDRLT